MDNNGKFVCLQRERNLQRRNKVTPRWQGPRPLRCLSQKRIRRRKYRTLVFKTYFLIFRLLWLIYSLLFYLILLGLAFGVYLGLFLEFIRLVGPKTIFLELNCQARPRLDAKAEMPIMGASSPFIWLSYWAFNHILSSIIFLYPIYHLSYFFR